MVKQYIDDIKSGNGLREKLIALRNLCKNAESNEWKEELQSEASLFCALLKNEDPKVRKNAALILGEIENQDLLQVLYQAYVHEKTRFLKADYLKAISNFKVDSLIPELQERLKLLQREETIPEERKHAAEEIRMLQNLLKKGIKREKHIFIPDEMPVTVVLSTNRLHREETAAQVTTGKIKYLRSGIQVMGGDLKELMKIRTYSDLFFPLKLQKAAADDPYAVGEALGKSDLSGLVRRFHKGEDPYYFRLEYKGEKDNSKIGTYLRRAAASLEKTSKGRWINSVEDYEVEIRLLPKKDGSMAAVLKLLTMPDRFSYRKEVVATSMSASVAALVVELASPYYGEKAQVLDPFCGVGTLLIERGKMKETGALYGVDSFGEAVIKGRENARRAGNIVYFINRDFSTFSHEYPFDEIITEFPRSGEELRELYHMFFERAGIHLKDNSILVLCSNRPEYIKEGITQYNCYEVIKSELLNERDHTTVYILRYKQGR